MKYKAIIVRREGACSASRETLQIILVQNSQLSKDKEDEITEMTSKNGQSLEIQIIEPTFCRSFLQAKQEITTHQENELLSEGWEVHRNPEGEDVWENEGGHCMILEEALLVQ